MKTKINNIHAFLGICIFLLLGSLSLSSCSDWTEMENLKVSVASPQTQDPALYKQYLEMLRSYKQRSHQITLVTFNNNEKYPIHRSQHMSSLPDSIDYLVLTSPELDNREISEKQDLKSKGVKMGFALNLDSIYLQLQMNASNHENEEIDNQVAAFGQLFANHMALVNKYGYDFITVEFNGFTPSGMTPEEKENELLRQEVIFSVFEGKLTGSTEILLLGCPENILIDKSIYDRFAYFILPTQKSETIMEVETKVRRVVEMDVPSDKIVVTANTFSLNEDEESVGAFFVNGIRKSAITETASWVFITETAGLAVYDVQRDYFNGTKDYQYTRTAIKIMNP